MSFTNPMFDPKRNETAPSRQTVHADQLEETHSHKALWVVVIALALAAGATAGYGFHALQSQSSKLNQLFANEGQFSSLSQRISATEVKLGSMGAGWNSLEQRVASVEGEAHHSLLVSREYARNFSAQLKQMTAEMNENTSAFDTRLQKVESAQASEKVQLARMRTDLQQRIESVRAESGQNISAVRNELASNSDHLDSLDKRLDRDHIGFEMPTRQTTALDSGFSLRVNGTNVRYQRYSGWIFLAQDHKFVWLKNQAVNDAVPIYSKDGTKQWNLVVTNISKDSVAGYLLVPAEQQSAATTASSSAASASTVAEGNE